MQMEKITYAFIDGGYVREALNRAMTEVFGVPGELAPETIAPDEAFKVYFYDCVDEVKRDSETEVTFQARRAAQEGTISRMRSRPGMHFRPGTLSRGRRPTQKEVDVLLAVEMLTHAFSRNMTHAVLVTGDLDFRPIVDALVRAGIFVEVWYEKRSYAPDLPAAADFGREINWHQLYNWNTATFRSAHCPPTVTRTGEYLFSGQVAAGLCEGRKVELLRISDRGPFVLYAERSDGVMWLKHDDRQVVERYFATIHGEIDWNRQV